MNPQWEAQAREQLNLIGRNNAVMEQARLRDAETQAKLYVAGHPLPAEATEDERPQPKFTVKQRIGAIINTLGTGVALLMFALCVLRFVWSFLWEHGNEFAQGTARLLGIALLVLVVSFVVGLATGSSAVTDHFFSGIAPGKPAKADPVARARREREYLERTVARFAAEPPAPSCWCSNVDVDAYAESLRNALSTGMGESAQSILPLQVAPAESVPMGLPATRNALASLQSQSADCSR